MEMNENCGIYKITNLINGKCYIGQSVHIKRRWTEHCLPSTKSVISSAIKKYGKENFSFEIIEECSIEELSSKEEYYIKYYNSITPNGYNIMESHNGSQSQYVYIKKDSLLKLIKDLKESSKTFQEIAEEYNLTVRAIYYINSGETHYMENEKYPLREVKDFSKKEHICIDCGKPISRGSTRCQKCMVDNYYKEGHPDRETLKKLIRTTPFRTIGWEYGVSDKAVCKWCKHYNLPNRKKDINLYTDEEWEKI